MRPDVVNVESSFLDPQQLLHKFFYYLDESMYDQLLDMFCSDATWHRQGKTLIGRAAISNTILLRSKTQRIRHIITNSFLNASDFTMIAYMTVYKFDDGNILPEEARIHAPTSISVVKAVAGFEDDQWKLRYLSTIPQFSFTE